jgi:hypothetical protein
MAISASSEHRDVVLTSTRTNLHDAIGGLLSAIIAHCLPARSDASRVTQSGCDRSTSVAAQATNLHTALSQLIDELTRTIDDEEGGISGVDLHGVMLGPDRCTIWGQACLDTPTPYLRPSLTSLTIEQSPGAISITVTLRTGE